MSNSALIRWLTNLVRNSEDILYIVYSDSGGATIDEFQQGNECVVRHVLYFYDIGFAFRHADLKHGAENLVLDKTCPLVGFREGG